MVKISTLAIILLVMAITVVKAGHAMDSSYLTLRSPVLLGRQETSAAVIAAKPKKSNFVSSTILENGTLFYVAVTATVALWCTGKSIHYALQRQDRYAGYLAAK
ncbi:hypothetical protein BGW37DRAFT_523097 [Umbelopsis sp. PMI_123]|nr:hypothetical protein BGW37DRAFT_523097 [Umbelopsis sp. PMI_123]